MDRRRQRKDRRNGQEAIPQRLDELTAEWFTAALAPGGVRVLSVDTEIIGTDIGFAGEVYRCHLEWEHTDESTPRSVIVKVPSHRPENRAAVEAINGYEREILVYQHLAGSLGLRMPAHLYSDFTPNPARWLEPVLRFLFDHLPMRVLASLTALALWLGARSRRRYILVIEDVADARPPSQSTGGSLADARSALTALANFHATNWTNHDLIAKHDFVAPINQVPRLRQAAYRLNRDQFLATFADSLTPEIVERLDAVQDDLTVRLDHLASEPWTVLHGDFRLDNLLFRPDGEVVVIDPQLIQWGRPSADLAYFLTTALEPQDAAGESELLRHYHQALVDAGVSDYELDTLVSDLAMSKDVLGHALVAYTGLLDTNTADSEISFTDLVTHRALGWLNT